MSYLSLYCFSFENGNESCGQVPSSAVIALRNIQFFLLCCLGGVTSFVLVYYRPDRDAIKKKVEEGLWLYLPPYCYTARRLFSLSWWGLLLYKILQSTHQSTGIFSSFKTFIWDRGQDICQASTFGELSSIDNKVRGTGVNKIHFPQKVAICKGNSFEHRISF